MQWKVLIFYTMELRKVYWLQFSRVNPFVLLLKVGFRQGSSVEKPETKRLLGRPRRRRVDNIRMDPQEVGCGYVDWIGLAQDRDRWRTVVSAVMNLRVPWNAGNFLTSCKPVSCSGRTLHHGVSKYRRRQWMRWAGHVARMGVERGCIESWWGNRRERDHWGDLGVDGWIILEWIPRRWDVGIWIYI